VDSYFSLPVNVRCALNKTAFLWFGSQAAGGLTYFALYDRQALREWAAVSLPKLILLFAVGQLPIFALMGIVVL
jgi:hypothetical protein